MPTLEGFMPKKGEHPLRVLGTTYPVDRLLIVWIYFSFAPKGANPQ